MNTTRKDTTQRGQRLWRKGDRAKVSILQVFRTSFYEHDQRRANTPGASGEVEVSQRSRQRREGVTETTLRSHLEADLNSLLNTIQLGSCISLEDTPHVERSILNYGFRDLSSVSVAEIHTPAIINTIRQSLIDHEPRLVRDSIEVQVIEAEDNARQRLSISVSAELMGDPVDIPLDFDAEVDLGAGKMSMSKLRVQV